MKWELSSVALLHCCNVLPYLCRNIVMMLPANGSIPFHPVWPGKLQRQKLLHWMCCMRGWHVNDVYPFECIWEWEFVNGCKCDLKCVRMTWACQQCVLLITVRVAKIELALVWYIMPLVASKCSHVLCQWYHVLRPHSIEFLWPFYLFAGHISTHQRLIFL